MTAPTPEKPRLPWRFVVFLGVVALGLVLGGLGLWMPRLDETSTANSDLGLALLSGGLAVAAGALISYIVYAAERRFADKLRASDEERNAALRAAEEARDAASRAADEAQKRTSLQLALAAAPSLRRIDLEESDLSGYVLPNKDLTDAKFRKAKLCGADLSGSDLSGADFEGADLTGAHLQRTTLINTNFTGATLTDADFDGAVRHFLYTDPDNPERILDAAPVFTDARGYNES